MPAQIRAGMRLAESYGMDCKGLDLLAADDPRTEKIWRALEAVAQPSYFLSWAWIENWLAALPADEQPSLAVVCDGGEPAAAFFLASRRVRRNLLMTKNALFFNASPEHADLSIEHNGMLAVPGARRSLSGILELLPDGWDELYLPCLDRYAFDDLGAPSSPLATRYRVQIEREANAPFVDLEAVRHIEGGYEALLPANTRTQLRRTRGLLGDIELEVARDEAQALHIYDEMLRLPEKRSLLRGAFGGRDPAFENFHRNLIVKRFAHGEIQLLRVSTGNSTLGCLYNLVSRGRVTFYQCGLQTFDDPLLKTGYLCHAAAIEYNAASGHSTYDLVGGRARQKDCLATGSTRLVWLRVQRPNNTLATIEEGVRKMKDLFAGDDASLVLRPV
ncbi:MAG TPA: GNAT family N-acetyltransferase [Kofleriaceae bacterium]|nr:GNAT family N-acetyltransferase [Kofleriaceae bacterium]